MNREKVLEILLRSQEQNKLHHAYVLSGPESPAKKDCVENFLAQLAPEGASTIERIRRGNHPDLLRIAPENSVISVDDVRELPKALSYAPLEAKKRVVLIESADCLNMQAANAVLKILEEPPGHTLFFLLCREPSDLPQTVRSRCQILRFSPMSEGELKILLDQEFPASPGIARALVLSEGSLNRARHFLALENQGGFQAACESLLNLWESSPRVPSSVVAWAESLAEQEAVMVAVDAWTLLLRDLSFAALAGDSMKFCLPEYRVRILTIASRLDSNSIDDILKSRELHRFLVYRELNGNLKLDFLSLICNLIISVGKK